MSSDSTDRPYRVLARKYRPAVFGELIGQEALVRTLSNAIDSGRLAQAYLFTGVRGVGKTTTARILARALNCVGPDGTGGPTIAPCGVCDPCQSIAEDRHVDVLEMDAASRTGVDGIRDLIDGVRYRPVAARYKVYIIDEVHMLSTAAFNALLKTLEEPPPHVVFIFATTEIRKVPMTVLSRCQRFDLRRVDAAVLAAHFSDIAAREEVTAPAAAIALIARAADGSVRDGLSILDQAIAHCGGVLDEAQLRDMLGLADRARVFDLFEAVMGGEIGAALGELGRQYDAGVDPLVVLQDLLELTHWLTRVKLVPGAADSITAAETERMRGSSLAERLSMPVLTRAWQMLLKGLGEARLAPDPLAAVEMVLVRLAYAADLPNPADLVRAARDAAAPPAARPNAPSAAPAPPPGPAARDDTPPAAQPDPPSIAAPAPPPAPAPVTPVAPAKPAAEVATPPASFAALVALVEAKREMVLHTNLVNNVHIVDFEPGRVEIRPTPEALPSLANDLGERLSTWTGQRWVVVVSGEQGAPTLAEQKTATRSKLIAEAKQHPMVQAALETFADAEVVDVRPHQPTVDHDSQPVPGASQEKERG